MIIPHGTAHHEAVRLREENQENIRIFRETIQVEKALIKQIVASVDPEYLKELRDDATSTITLDIPAILQHLFRNGICFGKNTTMSVLTSARMVGI